MTKFKASFLTMMTSLLSVISNTILSLVYTNCIIVFFGSSNNGLISLFTQFVSFFSVLEGGVTTAFIVSLYAPVNANDSNQVNGILKYAKKMFQIIGMIFLLSTTIGGIILLSIIESPLDFLSTFLLLLISIITAYLGFVPMNFYSLIINADNKGYIINLITLITRIIIRGIIIVLMFQRYITDIRLVYGLGFLEYFLDLVFYRVYVVVNYPDYYKEFRVVSEKKIKGTADVLIQKLAGTIFTSTDLVVISTIINLISASVYNVYTMIYTAGKLVLNAILTSPSNSLGQMISARTNMQIQLLKNKFDMFVKISAIVSAGLLTTINVITIPFIKIYTRNVSDVNYVEPIFVVLFFSMIYLQAVNIPFGMILNVTGNFKSQNKQCIIAAIINIFLSVMGAIVFGASGVIGGSVMGVLIILVYNVRVSKEYVFNEINLIYYYLNIGINFVIGIIITLFCFNLNIHIYSYFVLVAFALLICILSFIILFTVNIFWDKETINVIRFIVRSIYDTYKRQNQS